MTLKYLDCIWIQIKKLEENDWKETQIYRPYKAFESVLANSTPHDFPLIIPPEFNDQTIFPLPRVIFRMFDYTDVPEVCIKQIFHLILSNYIFDWKKEYILPGAHSIERFLVEEQLHSVINTYYLDRKLCASKLLNLNVTSKIPLNYMIIEVIKIAVFFLNLIKLVKFLIRLY